MVMRQVAVVAVVALMTRREQVQVVAVAREGIVKNLFRVHRARTTSQMVQEELLVLQEQARQKQEAPEAPEDSWCACIQLSVPTAHQADSC